MVKKVNLDRSIVTLASLFEAAREWETYTIGELNEEQLAVINLKRIIEEKNSNFVKGGGYECFICATGA